MTKYIECEAAIALASGGCHPANVAAEIAKLPAADVVEVRYGRWIDHEKDGFPLPTTCSRCFYPIDRFYKSNYCPNCGANMREREKEMGE